MGLRGPAAVDLSMPVRGEHLGSIFSVGRRRGTAWWAFVARPRSSSGCRRGEDLWRNCEGIGRPSGLRGA